MNPIDVADQKNHFIEYMEHINEQITRALMPTSNQIDEAVRKAVERVSEVFQRERYLLGLRTQLRLTINCATWMAAEFVPLHFTLHGIKLVLEKAWLGILNSHLSFSDSQSLFQELQPLINVISNKKMLPTAFNMSQFIVRFETHFPGHMISIMNEAIVRTLTLEDIK